MTPKRLRPRPLACALILGLMMGLSHVAAIAAQPIITGVIIVDIGVLNVGTTATAEILVQSDSATFTLDVSSDIGSCGLDAGTFVKSTDEKYTVQFDVDEGENDYTAGALIPVSITLWDGGVSGTWNTPITYGSAIDANSPGKPGVPDLDAASDNGQSAIDDVTNDDTPKFNGGAGSVEGSATVEVASSIDGPLGTAPANPDGSWTYTVPGGSELADGSHAVTITATDAAGNESVPSDPLNVLMDTQAPNDPGNRAPADDAWVNTTSPTFLWSAPGDPGGSGVYNYRVQIWGPATRSYYTAGLSYNPSLGAEGTYTWRLYALDVAGNNGNAGASTWTLNVDINPPGKPAIPDLNAASDNGQSATDDVTNDKTPTFDGNAGSVEGSTTVEVTSSIGGPLGTASANADGSWTYTVPGGSELADGSHAITITATDAAGNESVASDPLAVLVDDTDPTCSIPDLFAADDTGYSDSDNITQGNTPQFDGTASDASSGVWKVDVSSDAPVQTVTDSSGGGTYTVELADLTAALAYTTVGVSARVSDVAGNTYDTTGLTVYADRTLPAITLIAVEEAVGLCGTSCYSLSLLPSEFDVTISFSESVWQEPGDQLVLTFDLDSADWPGAPASGDGNALSFSGIVPVNTSATAVWQPQDEIRTHVVEDGDNSCDLSVTAISLAGSLFDVAGNAFVIPGLDATNNVSDSQDVSVDTTKPLISDLMFNTDGTYAVEQAVPYLVDACGLVVVYFSANVTDNCSILSGNVIVSVTLPVLPGEGPATLEDIVINRVQNGQDRVDITGNAVVRCLGSCPPGVCMSRVQIDVTATDCGGNAADSDATGTGEGLLDDIILPIPRDDRRQDMVMDESAVIDPLVEVRLDEFCTYRLILRASTPVRIDVMGNDADNLSHNVAHPFEPCIACGSCGGQTGCCAVMYIHEIVEPPSYGTATIEEGTGDCTGGTVIRYAPDMGRLGPDYFTYRTRDAFDNVSSVIATVYLQTVEETVMEDVAVIACSGEPTEFDVVAADLWVDRDPAVITFEFEIIRGPEHGVVLGDLAQIVLSPPSLGPDPNTGELVPTLDFTEAARIRLTYTPAIDYVGRDTMMIRIDDPFGAFAIAEIDIRVVACAPGVGEVPTIEVGQAVVLPLIVPESFASAVETTLGAMMLMSLEDGLVYPGALSTLWSEEINRYVLLLDTGPLPPGRYLLMIPLGNGERVELVIEVGETE